MKKFFLFLSAAAVLGFTACQQEMVPQKSIVNEETTFTFSSVKPAFDDETTTRTEWNGTTIQWSEGDQIRMAYTVAGVWQGASDTNTSPKLYASNHLDAATDVASFTVNTSFTATATGTHIFYGLYPGSLASSTDFSAAPKATISIPVEQTPSENSFDAAADVMIGVSEELDEKPSSEETVIMNWTRLVAHADLTIKNLTINSGETIEKIILTAQEGANLVGMHDLNLVTGEFSNAQGATNEIVIKADNLSYSGNTVEVWASMLPATLTELTVTVETDKAFYVRTFTGISREFKKNRRNTMNIGMSTAVRTEKATNLMDYEEPFNNTLGDFTVENETLSGTLTYVWSKNSGYAKASAYVGGANAATSYLVSPELKIGSNNSKLTFEHAANYLNGGAFDTYFSVVVFDGTTETVLALDVKPNGSSWTFVTSTVNLAAYKGKSIRIGFKYTSTTSVAGTWEVKNFKVTDVVMKQAAGLSYGENTELTVNVGDPFDAPELDNPNSLTVTYSSSKEDVATVNATTGAVTIVGTGTTVITAAFDGNADFYSGSASYTLTVVDPSAVSAWVEAALADLTAGDIFVIVGNGTYAMTNDEGTGGAPKTSPVTISGTMLTSAVADNLKWNVSGNATSGYTFYPNGNSAKWLYCNTTADTGSNNNMRVGTGDRKVFELNANNYLITKDQKVVRYLSIYNNADWRGYINTDLAASLKFYKYTAGVAPTPTTYAVTWTNPTQAGCSISATVGGEAISSGDEFESGTEVTITATAGTGFSFSSWTVDGVALSNTSANPATFTIGDSDVTLSASFVSVGGDAPDPETIDFSTLGLTNGQEYTHFTQGHFDVDFASGAKYYNAGTAMRVYGGGSFTVSSSYTIAKIELTFGTGDGSNAISTDVNTYSNGTWTGSANSVTFSVGGSSGHRRIKAIKVTYEGNGGTPAPTYAITWTNPTQAGCSVSATVGGEAINSGDAFEEGTVVTITATAGTGYTFSSWSVTGATVANASNASTTFTVGTADVSFSASFQAVQTEGATATFIFNTDAGIAALGIAKPEASAGTELGSSYSVDGVTMAVTNGTGTKTRVWNSSGTLDLRIYNGSSLTFSVASGKNIKSIVLAGSAATSFTANVGTFSSGTWTGSANSVTLTATATGKINTITITYE